MAFELFFFLICLISIMYPSTACGPLQAGREKTVNFNVSIFKLPAIMAYSADAGAKVKAPTISSTMSEAETYVRTLIKNGVKDVLYEQGRSALLPDSVISAILQQLDIQVSYEPLNCEVVVDAMSMVAVMDKLNCVIVDGTVTVTCMNGNAGMCMNQNLATNAMPILPKHLSISGSLKTSNAVMANWSNQMWQTVLNRVLRMITSGENGSWKMYQSLSAFVPDSVISSILQQLDAQVSYEALNCDVVVDVMGMDAERVVLVSYFRDIFREK